MPKPIKTGTRATSCEHEQDHPRRQDDPLPARSVAPDLRDTDAPPSAELRPPQIEELPAASALCLRSKAYWGYDAEFIQACKAELSLSPDDLAEANAEGAVIVAAEGRAIIGVAQLSFEAGECFLEKLFVAPERMGRGVGRALFDWALDAARGKGARQIVIEADPNAVPFYLALGCKAAGSAASAVIPGRVLPRLALELGARA